MYAFYELKEFMEAYGLKDSKPMNLTGQKQPRKERKNMKEFNTCEEIRDAFIKQGWAKDIDFIRSDERNLYNGKPLFIMIQTGNIYDHNGKIYRYNLTGRKEF
jgi:hypothetical protein